MSKKPNLSTAPRWIKAGTQGRSTDIRDTASWLASDQNNQDVCAALQAYDGGGDKAELVAQLKSMGEPFLHLGDLLERYDLVRVKRRTPTYQRSWRNARLEMAVADVRQRRRGLNEHDAIAEAAKAHGLTHKTVKKACDGEDMGLRRARGRK